MKKIISLIVCVIALYIPTITIAGEEPIYDATYNNGTGAFYANGISIAIKENASNKTEIFWNGGRQIIADTTTIFGGGTQGTTYETSNITMESGTVSIIYGGGLSLIEDDNALVKSSNIIIDGGEITESLFGGGLIYSTVNQTNLTINGGTVKNVIGGGAATATISGISYTAGNKQNYELSKNRVNETNVIINNGTINFEESYGTVFGGGQGYCYVKDANIIINEGNLSRTYVTAGGSNGYTENAKVKINGSTIYLVQSVNRGKLISTEMKMTSGIVEEFYIGGETKDPTVTGTVTKVEANIISGKVDNLQPGKSNLSEIVVEQNNYKALYVENTVTNSLIGNKEKIIKYIFNIKEQNLKLRENGSVKLTPEITTNPSGYEYLFEDETILWFSDDETIAVVDKTGNVTGIKEGKTLIRANLFNEDFVNIEVENKDFLLILIFLGSIFIIVVILLFLIIVTSFS